MTVIGVIAVLISLVVFPKQSVAAARDGVELCINVIVPSLFPFFVVSTLIIELGLAEKLGRLLAPFMRRVFNVSGACGTAFVLGFIGGYPVGAKTALKLYERGACTKAETERLLSFCNNSGPAFILGVVGAGVFSDSRIGLLLYFVHALASILVGLLFRRHGKSSASNSVLADTQESTSFPAAFTGSVRSAFTSTLNICGFVIFFTVFIRLLFLAGILPLLAKAIAVLLAPLGMSVELAEQLLTGIIELSSGVSGLRGAAESLSSSIAMAAFMLGWAGISIHCQVLSFLCDAGVSARTYICGKLLHGSISAILIFLVFRFFSFDQPVSSYLAQQVTGIAALGFSRAFFISAAASLAVLVVLLGLYCYDCRKKYRKSK